MVKALHLAPVVLFVYNRLSHTQQTIEALRANDLAQETELFIFSDGAKNKEGVLQVDKVRAYIASLTGFKSIRIYESNVNQGLSASVISGVSKVLEQYEKIIVLEDDLITSADFLTYMNNALDTYANNWNIYSISGYTFPSPYIHALEHDVFLYPRPASWGWATWKNRWEKADWDMKDFNSFSQNKDAIRTFLKGGEDMYIMLLKQQKGLIQSWAIRWAYVHFKNQAYSLYLKKSKVKSIGTDSSGTNLPTTKKYDTLIYEGQVVLPKTITPNHKQILLLKDFYSLSFIRRCINAYKFGKRSWLTAH